jgi:FdhD protein
MVQHHAYAVVGTGSKVGSCVHRSVARFDGERLSVRDDAIVQEEVLNVMVNGVRHHEMTCSPWDVEELAVGSLFLSGCIERREQVCGIEVDLEAGAVYVTVDDAARQGRSAVALPDGGVVLTGVFEPASAALFKPVTSQVSVPARTVVERVALLEDRSLLFRRTGGVHSAVLVDERGVIAWFEDIGRHSAVDKLAGWCFLNDVDVSNKMLLFSGRVPREIIVKVIRLGCPVIASPGAPTNLSIDLAQRWGVTLVGFAKHGAFNAYTHPERIC